MTSPRLWIAWLLVLVFGFTAPAQAMRAVAGLRTPLRAESHGCDYPINHTDPMGLDYWGGFFGELLRFAENTRPIALPSLFDGEQWHDPVGDVDGKAVWVTGSILSLGKGLRGVAGRTFTSVGSGEIVYTTGGSNPLPLATPQEIANLRALVGAENLTTNGSRNVVEIGGKITLKANVTRVALMEETLHWLQHRLGKIPNVRFDGHTKIALEREVKNYLINNAKTLGLDANEVGALQSSLARYERGYSNWKRTGKWTY